MTPKSLGKRKNHKEPDQTSGGLLQHRDPLLGQKLSDTQSVVSFIYRKAVKSNLSETDGGSRERGQTWLPARPDAGLFPFRLASGNWKFGQLTLLFAVPDMWAAAMTGCQRGGKNNMSPR